jgi:type I restriction enzyme M protein
MNVNERTFQGEIFRFINGILDKDTSIGFEKITQEENVGVKYHPRFADGKLYSSRDKNKIVSFELKNSSWDATDEVLVMDAAQKASQNGFDYFVTGTPRQLALYKTFQSGIPLSERKIKIYTLSNIKKDDEINYPNQYFEKIVRDPLTKFLKELSQIIHKEIDIHWDSIDVVYVNKLSSYILEASAEMLEPMQTKITTDREFKKHLKEYLRNQEIFNVTLDFNADDVYKICQLANYLLFIKIIFYSYLQRDVKDLNLKPIEIPNDIKLLNITLRTRFDDVLKHDYDKVFNSIVLDEFEFSPQYLPILKQNIEEIKKLEFNDLNVDIMGAIYNTLIDNQEQHDRGQHFTNTNEVDIICAFCFRKDTNLVLDSGCGAGTFLVRAYNFLKYYNPNLKHEQLLEMLWGIDISPFPVFLSTINLCLLDIKIKDNYPMITTSDFLKVRTGSEQTFMFSNSSKLHKFKKVNTREANVTIPEFNICIGNPPYIRQELIEHKEDWIDLTKAEHSIKKINKQSDLYFYYLLHTASFLKNGGRLGYVISTSWLDVTFGGGLQKFLLDNFKIIAIIEHQTKRSFTTALINTVILIVEKCDNEQLKKNNLVKFAKVFKEYSSLIGKFDDARRINNTIDFVTKIESTQTDYLDNDLEIKVVSQDVLESKSIYNGKYENGYWGAIYLRAPQVYFDIMNSAQNAFIALSEVCKIKYSIKSGKNDFFYLINDTELVRKMSEKEYSIQFGTADRSKINWKVCGWYYSKLFKQHFVIENEFMSPIFKTQSEAKCLDVDVNSLKQFVLFCSKSKEELKKHKSQILKYILRGEEKGFSVDKAPSVKSRTSSSTIEWYDLTRSAFIGDFIFPAKLGEKYRLIDNRISKVPCDKVNYAVKINPEYKDYAHEIFLILNSICFRFFIDLFSRQMVVKVSDVDLNLVSRTRILNPVLFRDNASNIDNLYNSLKSREQESIFTEVNKPDKRAIDLIILKSIGLGERELEELYSQATQYIQQRKEKSESVQTKKTKKTMDNETSLRYIDERFPDIPRYNKLIMNIDCELFNIPSGKPVYRKESSFQADVFNEYIVNFRDVNKAANLVFDNEQQLELFRFLKTIGYDNKTIKLPKNADNCNQILDILKDAYESNIHLMKSLLKSNRSKTDAKGIFRDLLFQ